MEITFTAKWIRDIYKSDDYTVALFENPDTKQEYKCVGSIVPTNKGVNFEIKADEEPDDKYGGYKYTVKSYDIAKCKCKQDTIDLLSSGLFPGIGKAMAERIYKKFKEDSLEIIEDHPEKLSEVRGISAAKISRIVASYRQNRQITEAAEYLAKFGLTTKQVHEIKKISPTTDILEFVKSDPYALMEIRGVSFETADLIAADNLVPKDDLKRVGAAVEQMIKNGMARGHIGCEYLPVATGTIKMLGTGLVNPGNIKDHILELIKRDRIAYRKIKLEDNSALFYLYLPSALKAETELAESIKKNIESREVPDIKNMERSMAEQELKIGVRLDDCQKAAVKMALSGNFSVITGGPGTGKTTIIKIITSLWEEKYTSSRGIVLMSPTGRAARRMSEATGRPAATIHSTLRFGITDTSGIRNEMSDENVIENSLVVIDECSMIDVFLARDMMEHLKSCTVVFVGDADQLPSVGSGNVLEDIISSGTVPVTKLEYSHRQEEGSTICENADRIKRGEYNLKAASDFSIALAKTKDSRNKMLEKLENKMIQEYERLIDIYGMDNVAILCPFNKHPAGQLSINRRLQERFNPYSGSKQFKGINGMVFRVGDPVMQLVNEEDVSNGDVGWVTAIDRVDGREVLIVKYYDCMKTYTKDNIENLTLAYAMTVHKSQGSEYDAVVTCLSDEHGSMIKRNIIYTAVTRAKKQVVLCGTQTAIKKAILNDKTEKRNTLLWYDLKKLIKAEDKVVKLTQINEKKVRATS